MRWLSALKRRLACSLRERVPLASMTTWGVEGRARYFASPAREGDLSAIMEVWEHESFPLWILGGGSNVLPLGGELPGLMIRMERSQELSFSSDSRGNVVVDAPGGVFLPFLLGVLAQRGWSGCEPLEGIPGTLGGAVVGNAGGSDGAIGDVVAWVDTVEPGGIRRRWEEGDLRWEYRRCNLHEGTRIVVRCALRLSPSNSAEVGERIRSAMVRRRRQPLGRKTAGSVFKNPEGLFAGALLEGCGCKGMSCGGARVSEIHANFIENDKNATGEEILALIRECRRRVKETYGVLLELEVQVWGDAPEEALGIY